MPPSLEGEVQVPGFPGVRSWGDAPGQGLQESVATALHREGAAPFGNSAREVARKSMDVLVLTGGGDNGAFGAGVLCGWTEHGDRPAFQLVTGLSTGALMAPLAFLGPAYDGPLKEVYTTISAKNIFKVKNIFSILTSESLADNRPLADLIAWYMTGKVLEDVAAEHRKGRRLFAGTTQLDSQRLVIWDLGAIAAGGRPQALALFRKILLASSALPGIFPPVYFQVEAGGQTYQEMHVDGATAAEALTYEYALQPLAAARKVEAGGGERPRRLFVIRNGRLRPEWQEVKPQSLSIMPRALATLIKNQSVGDLYRLYFEAQRDGFDYHLAVIPEDFQAAKREDFDPAYMNRLFRLGFDLARQGYPWAPKPPRL
ncbi:MAG: patatin family protein [Deltaproteobacteria bacterium]|nr:patatin family protein [Deltaproteobacteria bacterium]